MRYGRIDHIVLQVPDIDVAHSRLRGLGFAEAWPLGRNWPSGPTSGIALGGINLELLQPDENPPDGPALAEIVFAPDVDVLMEDYGRVAEKIETDPAKLAARGFPASMQDRPQRICTNAFPGPDSLWPHFVCDYAPFLAQFLATRDVVTSSGPAVRIEIGALRVQPRFVVAPEAPDLARFVAETEMRIGPKLQSGGDEIVFASGARLILSRLTIEA